MIVLALETATRDGSVAVARDGVVMASARGDGTRPHASRLPADALALLAARALTLRDVDVFAVCLGPGAFTGLRVGIAAAQGLAFATARPVVGISAFEALAAAALDGCTAGEVAGVWLDGARTQVFAARYVVTPGLEPRFAPIGEAVAAPAAAVMADWTTGGPAVSRWIGDGAVKYREVLGPAAIVEPAPDLAPLVARLATHAARAGRAGAPHALRPIYVRPPDVELSRNAGTRR